MQGRARIAVGLLLTVLLLLGGWIAHSVLDEGPRGAGTEAGALERAESRDGSTEAPRAGPSLAGVGTDPSAPGSAPASGQDVREIAGRVFDAASGRPLPGVRVERWRIEIDPTSRPATDPISATESDAEGRFRLVGGEEDGADHVRFEMMGYGTVTRFRRGSETEPLDVGLRPAVTLHGVVVDESGAGIPEVRVRSRMGSSRAPRTVEVVTDARGSFALESLDPSRAVTVEARMPGRLDVDVVATPGAHTEWLTRLEILMPRGNAFRLRLLRSGAPCAGVPVAISRSSGPDLRLVTDAEGVVRFADARVAVRAIVHLPSEDPVWLGPVPAGEEQTFDLDVLLADEQTDDAPEPAEEDPWEPPASPPVVPAPADYPPSLRVVALDEETREPVTMPPLQVLDAHGRMCPKTDDSVWRAPATSTVTVRTTPGWTHTGYEPLETTVETGTADHPASVEIAVRRSPRVRVRALRPDGAAVTEADGVEVVFRLTSGVRRELPIRDPSGVLVPVDAGVPSRVFVTSHSWPTVDLTLPAVARDAAEPDPVVARFLEPLTLSGSVRTVSGLTVPDAVVDFVREDGTSARVRCGPHGAFEIRRLAPARGVVVANAERYRCSVPTQVVLEAGAGTVVVPALLLRPLAAVVVVVKDAKGWPVEGCIVSAPDGAEAVTDRDGRAALRLGGEEAEIRVRPKAGDPVTARVDLRPPEQELRVEVALP